MTDTTITDPAAAEIPKTSADAIEQAKRDFEAGHDPSISTVSQADVDKLTQDNNDLRDRVDELEQRLADSEKDRQAAEDRASDIENSSMNSVARADMSGKPRKVGEADSKLSGEDLTNALADADKAEKKVEIAFSDGKMEVPGVPAVIITGDVWKDHRLGKMLRDPVEVVGSPPGGTSYQIAGYALLIDGKQVAYCKRSDPISIAPGRKISLADDIVFS